MSLHLTPDLLEANYEMLRLTPPFNSWGLPEGDDLVFHVHRTQRYIGAFWGRPGGQHEIAISNSRVGSLETLTRTMAHEMIHLRQELAGTTTANTMHNADFRRLVKVVARHHCFDPMELG